MALSKRKQALVDEMKSRRFSDEEIDWHTKKSTIVQMERAIENDEALVIIARMAAEAGRQRTS